MFSLKKFSSDVKWAIKYFCGDDEYKSRQNENFVKKIRKLYDGGYDKWENSDDVLIENEGIADLIAECMLEEQHYRRIRYWLWLELIRNTKNKPLNDEQLLRAARDIKRKHDKLKNKK